jgi:hypothetical protein
MEITDLASELLSTCADEFAHLLADFDAAPSCSGMFDIATVGEILVLGNGVPETQALHQMASDSAARWLASGVLEDLCFSRVELTYATALLAFMAQSGAGHCETDMAGIKRLCEGRLIGRSEMPMLTQQLVGAYLSRCGVQTDFGEPGRRDLATMIDKRLLRARSDEYDLLVVLMCAQLLRLGACPPQAKPTLYPEALLTHVVRSKNENWLPVLAFLCAQFFSLSDGLRREAVTQMRASLPSPGKLLAAPQSAGIDSEYIGRAGRGLRIRSTVGLVLSLCTIGDFDAEN